MTTSSNSTFKLSSQEVAALAAPQLPARFLWEFLADGRTPARAITDETLHVFMPALEGPGTIYELGAGGDYYKKFRSAGQPYLTSNLSSGCDTVLDMTRLDLADNSVDALLSVFALEHLFDFQAVFDEHYRVLKPGGRFIVIAPFQYYYHAAPDDYFRFSSSALDQLVARFDVLARHPIGGRGVLFAEFLHEKKVLGSSRGWLARLLMRFAALPFLACSLKARDSRFALGFIYVCEKRHA